MDYILFFLLILIFLIVKIRIAVKIGNLNLMTDIITIQVIYLKKFRIIFLSVNYFYS
ncbi:MAG: hypothetical protein BAJALOKI2v1_70001 [Promethearchaeota archaeon]|nr:MAG: hypothetical protein BAJALOKI2v1_70001 [Candidatus Lokiarchaeota archaeon]